MLVSLYLSSEVYVACTNKLVVDGVQNLSVKVLLQGQGIAGGKEAYNVLKLNISWLPPNSIRQPSSYRYDRMQRRIVAVSPGITYSYLCISAF